MAILQKEISERGQVTQVPAPVQSKLNHVICWTLNNTSSFTRNLIWRVSQVTRGMALAFIGALPEPSVSQVYPAPDSERKLDRRLAGVFYADIASYARLSEQDEEGTHVRVVQCMKIASECVRFHGGDVAHFAGDAILAEFRSAMRALECAICLQTHMRRFNRGIEQGRQVQFRVGVNVGEVIPNRGDIYGNAVNLAARLEGLADPGGICVSDAVRFNIGRTLPVRFVPLGEQKLKNFKDPVLAYHVDLDPGQPITGSTSKVIAFPAAVTE